MKAKPLVGPGIVTPLGHYSPGVSHGGLVYVSGQLGLLADGSHSFDRPFAEQVRAALDNVLRVIAVEGLDPEDLLKVNAYIVGAENWAEFNAIYAEVMGAAKPARAVVPVPGLHFGYLIELDAIAACRPGA